MHQGMVADHESRVQSAGSQPDAEDLPSDGFRGGPVTTLIGPCCDRNRDYTTESR